MTIYLKWCIILIFNPDDELEGVVVESPVEVEAVAVLRPVEVRVDGHGRADDVDAALLEAAQGHQLSVCVFYFCCFNFLKLRKIKISKPIFFQDNVITF